MVEHQVFPPPPSREEAETNPVALLELREHQSRERLVKVQEANVSGAKATKGEGEGMREGAPALLRFVLRTWASTSKSGGSLLWGALEGGLVLTLFFVCLFLPLFSTSDC